MGIILHPFSQAHLQKKRLGLLLNLLVNLFFPGLVVRLLLCQELSCQHHIAQGRVLGKEIEGLEHQAEVEALPADLRLLLGLADACVKKRLTVHPDDAGIRLFQKIQTA